MNRPECCKIDCLAPAAWRVTWGPTPDDFTLSCDAHLAWHMRTSDGERTLDGFVVSEESAAEKGDAT